MSRPLAISVIVPLGPAEQAWRPLLTQLAALPEGAEVIVVCCDAPTARAVLDVIGHRPRQRLLQVEPGRAQQLNAGATAANGDMLWFVHADTRLPDNAWPQVHAHAERWPKAIGYFDLRFDDGPWTMAINRFGVWWRCRLFGLPFGDQALVMSRQLWEQLGGFPIKSAGEDHALIAAARRAGIRCRPVGATVATSARKYITHGWLTITAHHLRSTWQQARDFGARQ